MKKIVITLISVGVLYASIAPIHAVAVHPLKVKQQSVRVQANPQAVTSGSGDQSKQTEKAGTAVNNKSDKEQNQLQTGNQGQAPSSSGGSPTSANSGDGGPSVATAAEVVTGAAVVGAGGHFALEKARQNATLKQKQLQELDSDKQSMADLRANPQVQKAIDLQKQIDEYKNLPQMEKDLTQLGKNLDINGELKRLTEQRVQVLRSKNADTRSFASEKTSDLSHDEMKKSVDVEVNGLEKSPDVRNYLSLQEQKKQLTNEINSKQADIDYLNESPKPEIIINHDLMNGQVKQYQKQINDLNSKETQIDSMLKNNKAYADEFKDYKLWQEQKQLGDKGKIGQADVDKQLRNIEDQHPDIVKDYNFKQNVASSRAELENRTNKLQNALSENQEEYGAAKEKLEDRQNVINEMKSEKQELEQKSKDLNSKINNAEKDPTVNDYNKLIDKQKNFSNQADELKKSLNDIDKQAEEEAQQIIKNDPKFARYYNLEKQIDNAKNEGWDVEDNVTGFKGKQYELTQRELDELKQNPDVQKYFDLEQKVKVSDDGQPYRFADTSDEKILSDIRGKLTNNQVLTTEEKNFLNEHADILSKTNTYYSKDNDQLLKKYLDDGRDPYKTRVNNISQKIENTNKRLSDNSKRVENSIKAKDGDMRGSSTNYQRIAKDNETLISEKEKSLQELKSLNSDSPEVKQLIQNLEKEISQDRTKTDLIKNLTKQEVNPRFSNVEDLNSFNEQKIKALKEAINSDQINSDPAIKELVEDEYARATARYNDFENQIVRLKNQLPIKDSNSVRDELSKLQDFADAQKEYITKMDELNPGLRGSEVVDRKVDLNHASLDHQEAKEDLRGKWSDGGVSKLENNLAEKYSQKSNNLQELRDIDSKLKNPKISVNEKKALDSRKVTLQEQNTEIDGDIKIKYEQLRDINKPNITDTTINKDAVQRGAKYSDINSAQNDLTKAKNERLQLKSELNELQSEQKLKNLSNSQEAAKVDNEVKSVQEQLSQADQKIQALNDQLAKVRGDLKARNMDGYINSDNADLDMLVRNAYAKGKNGKFDVNNLTSQERSRLADEFERMSNSATGTEQKAYKNIADKIRQLNDQDSKSDSVKIKEDINKNVNKLEDGKLDKNGNLYSRQSDYDALKRYDDTYSGEWKSALDTNEPIEIDYGVFKKLDTYAKKDSELKNFIDYDTNFKNSNGNIKIIGDNKTKFYDAYKKNYEQVTKELNKDGKLVDRAEDKNLIEGKQQLKNDLANAKNDKADLQSKYDAAKSRQDSINSRANGDEKDADLRQQIKEKTDQISQKNNDITKSEQDLNDARWKKPIQNKLNAELTSEDKETLSRLVNKMKNGEALSSEERSQLQSILQKTKQGMTSEQRSYFENASKAKTKANNSLKTGQQEDSLDNAANNGLELGSQEASSGQSSLALGNQGASNAGGASSGVNQGQVASQEQGALSQEAAEERVMANEEVEESVAERAALEERAEAELAEELLGGA